MSLPALQSILDDPRWVWGGVGALVLALLAFWLSRVLGHRSRRKRLLARLNRLAYESLHQVLVPDGMGGNFHIDHLLLTARGLLVHWVTLQDGADGLRVNPGWSQLSRRRSPTRAS